MFATGPANNCALEMFTTDAYASITTFKGMENIRTLEVMIDLMLTGIASSTSNLNIFGESNSFFFDVDYNGAVANPLSGLRFVVTRSGQKTATPSDVTPDFGKRYTLWAKDDQSTVQARINGASGTGVTYTTTEAATKIVSPSTDIHIGVFGTPNIQMHLYEAAIRVNGRLVFHVRPRLYMETSASPGTIPDLSGYGNDLTVGGTHGTDYRYIPSWSRQVPYSGKENVG